MAIGKAMLSPTLIASTLETVQWLSLRMATKKVFLFPKSLALNSAQHLPMRNLVAITSSANGELATALGRISLSLSNLTDRRAKRSDRAMGPGRWLMEKRAYPGM